METGSLKITAVLLSGQELESGGPVHEILCLVSHHSQLNNDMVLEKVILWPPKHGMGVGSWGVKMAGELTWVRTKLQKSTSCLECENISQYG